MQAFSVSPQPSRLLRRCQIALFALSFLAWWLYFPLILSLLGSLATLIIASLSLHTKQTIRQIHISPQGHSSLILAEHAQPQAATLLPERLTAPFLMILIWQTKERRHYQALLPDSVSREEWRRLLVWADWGIAQEED